MRLVADAIGPILLVVYPAALSAQAVSYSAEAPSADGASFAEAAAPNMPLRPQPPASREDAGKRPGGLQSAVTVVGSLALVLGIFFSIVWVLRRASPHGLRALPPDAFEVLGRAPLAARQQVYLLRCGNKLLLVALGAAGAETLTEITDAAEVDRLVGLCQQSRARQTLRQAENRNA